jgi:outer membrane protein TolC
LAIDRVRDRNACGCLGRALAASGSVAGEKGPLVKTVLPAVVVLAAMAGASRPVAAQGQAPAVTPAPLRPSPLATSPFLGGVPSGEPTAEPLALSLSDAINRALEHNLGALTAEQAIDSAAGARWRMLAGLLPTVNGHVTETRQKVNLAAFGFPLPEGVPSVVGPFNVFDARVALSQPVLDFGAINDVRAESHSLAAAKYSYRNARDLVVLVAANLYLQSLAEQARAESARVQLETAQALYNQAVDLKKSGIAPGIDVLRAQVQLATRRERTTVAENDFEKSKLQLARVAGLPIGQTFTLSDKVPYAPVPEMVLKDALEQAYRQRPDYQAALERVRAAESARAAIVDSRLPSLQVHADYGALGLTPDTAVGTYVVVGAVNVPIFQGGRTHGRLLEADAQLRNRQAEAADLKAGIYYDVRTAFLDLRAGREQLEVATQARDLANQQLGQARDRFAAGVADNLEVVQAQDAVALADEQYIAALYSYNVSKAALARALGVAEAAAHQYLGGSR